MRISHLRGFFERIIEWDYLDDAAAAALLAAARAVPDLFDRVCVEVLARTGLRSLTVDAVVQIGQGHWLRTPVGKLHTDRYIPLHPKVKELLEQWRTYRGEESKSALLFIDRGRPVPQTRVDRAVHKAAAAAGLSHTTPHQMRHTLATQFQRRHEPRSHCRAAWSSLNDDDNDLRPNRGQDRGRGVLRRQREGRSAL